MQDSKYQTAIFEWVKNPNPEKQNAIVPSTAGSGKTTTAIKSLNFMPVSADKVFLAFNKKIATELQSRISRMGIVNAKAATFHSEFLANLVKVLGRVQMNNSKVYFLAQKYCEVSPELKFATSFVQKLVGFAKDNAFGVKGQTSIEDRQAWMDLIAHHDIALNADCTYEEMIEIAIKVLKDNNRDTKVIDFSDMLYFTLLFDVKCKQYDWIIVDEAQDTNVCRKLLLDKIRKPSSRMLIVGDKNQAIYGFAGCEANSMDLLRDMFNCIELPLSICYRCGKNIIKEAQKYVEDIEAWELAPEGEVSSMSYNDFLDALPVLNLSSKDGIICRNNAPNVALAFALIRLGIGCHIEGKEIGQNLITLCNKWKVSDLNTFCTRLSTYFDKEMAKANRTKMAALEDKYETMVILIERCQSLGKHTVAALKSLIESMFSDTPEGGTRPDIVTLSSIHKAKGLEFDRVFTIGNSQFIPSKYATQDHQLVQENNLLFIATTRAQSKLINIFDVPSKSNKPETTDEY